jgi:histidyl-tRNA synthetase
MDIITNKKTPIGTFDISHNLFDVYEDIIQYFKLLFKQYGGRGLETPVFEIRENLLNKYGDEAEKLLIFNLQDHGGDLHEKYTLRYDLTIPKIRYILSNKIKKDRIYSIGKVYRRDNPSSGRFREFYQADFDIIGESNLTMISEYLLFKMVKDFMNKYNLEYTIHINFTHNLYYILVDLLNIDKNNFKNICSTIDKLDKNNFEDIVDELKKKDLDDEQINLLKLYLNKMNPLDQLSTELYIKLLDLMKDDDLKNKLKFNPTLARGLDYYNGIIFEIKLTHNNLSIISGGRYDNIINSTSLIGISFGLSRIIDILKPTLNNKWNDIYYLIGMKNISFHDKIKVWNILEKKFNQKIIISDEYEDKKLTKVITYCITNNIKYLYIIGENEFIHNNVIKKDLENNTQELICLD